MRVGIACSSRGLVAQIREHIPFSFEVATLTLSASLREECREGGLQALFQELRTPAPSREEAAQWREIFMDNCTDVVLVGRRPDRELVLRTLRLGVYEVLCSVTSDLAADISRILGESSRERAHIAERDVFIRDFGEAMVTIGGRRVLLTRTEFDILRLLIECGGRFITSENLIERVWGRTAANRKEDLYVYISRLREKLEEVPAKPRLIVSSRGLGYAFMGAVASYARMA